MSQNRIESNQSKADRVMASVAADSTAGRTTEGPISAAAASRAMDGLQAGDTTPPLRSRKRPSALLHLEDDEEGAAAAANFGNPGPDSVAAGIGSRPSRAGGSSRNEEERIQGRSLQRAHSCLALVGGGRRCSCSGHQHQLEDENENENDNDDDEERCRGHAMENDSSNAAGSRSAESRRRIKRIKSEPSIGVLTEAAAIVSVDDGSSESSSSSSNGDRHQQPKKSSHPAAAAEVVDAGNPHVLAGAEVDHDGVPITPAYGVPPRPELCPADMDPDTFIRATVHAYLGYEPQIRDGLSLPSPDFFPPITEDHLAAYDTDVVAAVRENHMDQIRSLHDSGRALSCCNRFGESLIHMACRRGYADAVTYLLEEAHVSVRIRDDCGRTPLHDACWHRTTQYNIVDTIIRVDPALLCISDKRGHTPFAYARREHWPLWRQFLFDRTDWIVAGFAQKEIMNLFGDDSAEDDKSKACSKVQ